MKYLIITGASKGLGAEIVKGYAGSNTHILSISRTENKELSSTVQEMGAQLTHFPFDLAHVDKVEGLMESIFKVIDLESALAIHLVNNAGLLQPMKPIERCTHEEIIRNHHVNLVAPMLIVSSFCRFVEGVDADKRVLNVTSGAAKRPIYGWSLYGSAKAGLDLFSQGASVDQKEQVYPVQVTSFGPGIMDTDMQAEIRATNEEDFINVETFKEYKESGKLLSPKTVADVVLRLLATDDFPNGEVVSVQDYF